MATHEKWILYTRVGQYILLASVAKQHPPKYWVSILYVRYSNLTIYHINEGD